MALVDWLKQFLASRPKQGDAVICALATQESPIGTKDIKNILVNHGARKAKDWNIAVALNRAKELVIGTPEGWELSESGLEHARALGFPFSSVNIARVKSNLRSLLSESLDDQTVSYLYEVIIAFEARLFRSAIVMSWVAAAHILKEYIVANKLADFNTEAQRRDSRWRAASDADGLSRMKEYDLLQISVAIGVLSNDVKKTLERCLERRNSCGHPNSYLLDENTVAHHVETIILNVFNHFGRSGFD